MGHKGGLDMRESFALLHGFPSNVGKDGEAVAADADKDPAALPRPGCYYSFDLIDNERKLLHSNQICTDADRNPHDVSSSKNSFSLFSDLALHACCTAEEAAVAAREHVSSAAEAAALSARVHFSSMISLTALGERDHVASALTPALDTRPASVALDQLSHDRLVPAKARVGGIDERFQVRYSRGKCRMSPSLTAQQKRAGSWAHLPVCTYTNR